MIYKGPLYIATRKIGKLWASCFRISHYKSMVANNTQVGSIFDHMGMVRRIYKEDRYTLLHTKYERCAPCGLIEEDYFYVLPMTPPGRACMDPRGRVGKIYKDVHHK